MKNKIVIFLFFTTFFTCFSQTDTIQLSVHKFSVKGKVNNIDFTKNTVNDAVKSGTHFRFDVPFAGIKGEFLQCAIDTSNLKTAKDSTLLMDFAKNHFLLAQRDYFNLIGKTIPDIQGTLLTGEQLNLSSFFGKPTLLMVFDADNQLSLEVFRDDLLRLQAKYEQKGLKFLIASRNSREEMLHYAEDYKMTIPIMPNLMEATALFSKHFLPPYFIFLDKKGKVQHLEVLNYGKQWYEQKEVNCENCYIYHSKEKKYKQKSYFYEKLMPILDTFFTIKN